MYFAILLLITQATGSPVRGYLMIVIKRHIILLEHGSTESGRYPQSIVHAHLHLIPFNFNVIKLYISMYKVVENLGYVKV